MNPDAEPSEAAVARVVRRRVGTWIAPALLVAFACAQIAVSQTTALTAWKGGGFGMFASTDQQFSRFIYATGVTQGGRAVRLKLSFAPDDERLPRKIHSRVRTYPNEADLRWIARSLLSIRLIRDRPDRRDTYRVPKAMDVDAPKHHYARLASVTLQMYAKRMDLGTNEVRAEPIGPHVIERAVEER